MGGVILLALTLNLFLRGCNSFNGPLERGFEEKKIPLKKKEVNFENSSEIFTMEKEIQLETKKECFIVEIEKVMVYDTFIVVLDHNYPLPYVFNDQGEFSHSIGRRGKGPGEIDDNVFTSMNDSILSIISFPQNVIYQYSIKNDLMNTIDLKKKKYFFTKCFYSGSSYFLSHCKYNLQRTFLGLYHPDTEKLDKLWTIGEEENERLKKEYDSDFFMTSLYYASKKDDIFLTYNNEYKIHRWKNNQYKGYYTNEFDEFEFYHLKYGQTAEEIDNQIGSPHLENIRNIHFLFDEYLIVNITTEDPEKKKRVYKVFNIINVETNEIITGIENLIHNIVGFSDNMLIHTMLPLIVKEGSPMPPKDFYDPDKNPKLKFYRFHPEKL